MVDVDTRKVLGRLVKCAWAVVVQAVRNQRCVHDFESEEVAHSIEDRLVEIHQTATRCSKVVCLVRW